MVIIKCCYSSSPLSGVSSSSDPEKLLQGVVACQVLERSKRAIMALSVWSLGGPVPGSFRLGRDMDLRAQLFQRANEVT